MTITIPHELEERLKGEAARQGVEAAEYARRLIERALPQSVASPDLATVEFLERWESENQTDDPAELARREREFEEFKEAMNKNRLESDGPHSRKIYP